MATPTFEPTRAKWWGVRTSNPTLTLGNRGAWWFRSDLRCYAYWDGYIVHYWGGIGGVMFYGTGQLIAVEAGNYALNVTLSTPWTPTTINRIISVYNVSVSPTTDSGTPVDIVATAPVVGFTLVGIGAGTTVVMGVIATGW